MLENIKNKLEELDIDYCYSKGKVPLLQKDEVTGGRFKSSVKCKDFTSPAENIGLIFKEDGIKIKDKFICCIDIDAKKEYGNTEKEQDELFEKTKEVMKLNKWYPHIERTKSGGYHIWITTDKVIKAMSVPVEIIVDEKGKKVNKKEIEVFTHSRFMIIYSDKIDFSKLDFIPSEELEMLNSLSCIDDKEDFEEMEEIETNTGKITEYLNKAFTNIPEIKSFKAGDWDSYNFVKDEIMRFFIALNQEEEFLKIIKDKYYKFFHVWENFPAKYLEKTNGNRSPSKNSKHIKWLEKIGYKKKFSKKDILLENSEVVFRSISGGNPIRIGDSIFIYNGKSYEWLSPIKYDEKIYRKWKQINGRDLKKEEMSELVFQLDMYLKDISEDYNPANKLIKPISINLAFTNGTLYIYDGFKEFKENYFNPQDKVFIEFSIAYLEDSEKGILDEWVNARFNSEKKKQFFKMVMGDLFSTNANTDVHGYFWGGAELGKSTFVSLMQSITTGGTVELMKLDKIKDKFSRVRTLRTPIMVADESSERNIPESEYKATISREADDYELKNVQNFTGIPIAKIITFGNVLPNIKMDEGVKRRLCTLKVESNKVCQEMGKQEFAEEFGKCGNELVHFIISGIIECFKIKWDLSSFYKENFSDERDSAIFSNDSFAYFVKENFTKQPENDKIHFCTSTEAFQIFNGFLRTLDGTAISKMSTIKFTSKMRELGIQKIRVKIKEEQHVVFHGLTHTEKSYTTLLNYCDIEDFEKTKILKRLETLRKQ